MKKIRTLIVDDEPLARKRISNLLQDRPDFEIVGECANGRQAGAAIQKKAPDLVFLDIQIPDLDGFGVLRALEPAQMPMIIFVTAYDHYALQAFEVHAVDYLLKPFDDERFERSLDWVRSQLQRDKIKDLGGRISALIENYIGGGEGAAVPEPIPVGEPRYIERLMIKSAGRIFFVKIDEIDWIEAEGYYVRLHVRTKSHLLRETMTGMEGMLNPGRFVRIHRSTIVNIMRVKELKALSHGEYVVLLQDGTTLKLSRSYRDNLQPLLGDS